MKLTMTCVTISAVFSTIPAVNAADCRNEADTGIYTVCSVDLGKEKLHIFMRNSTGAFFQKFSQVNAALMTSGKELEFAMNGGMFELDLSPIGLLVSNSLTVSNINLRDRPIGETDGSKKPYLFYDLPNGVFWVKNRQVRIVESKSYSSNIRPELAIQSGPVLVAQRAVPPYLKTYNSPGFKRNAVCITANQKVIFIIWNRPVGIRDFANFMADQLGCWDALYLDGCRSALFSKQLTRHDTSCPDEHFPNGRPMGAIIGTVQNREEKK